jgi:hypothetical protein
VRRAALIVGLETSFQIVVQTDIVLIGYAML